MVNRSAIAILDELTAKGAKFSCEKDRLHVRAPRGLLSEALQQEIQAKKSEMLGAVRARENHWGEAESEASRRLADDGWTVVRAESLGGELVIWLRDESVTVPDRLSGLVRYTKAELAALHNATEAQLRDIHRAKRELPDFHLEDLTQTHERT